MARLRLGRVLLRLLARGRDVGRLLRNVGGEALDRLVDALDGNLAVREILNGLQVVERSNAGEAVPRIYQPASGQSAVIAASSFWLRND